MADLSKLTKEELLALLSTKEENEQKSLEQIVKLKKEVASKKDLKPTPSVEVDGVTYDINVASFITKTGDVTVAQLIEDQDLCQELIEKGSHILSKRGE